MKVLQISAVRAIIVLVTGFLLVKYREDTMTWMTITVGVLFLISGLVACMVYYFEKEKVAKKTAKAALQEGQQEEEDLKSPSFPIAGVGSIVLGIILAVMPNTFTTWMVYILSALLILGAVNQFMNLARSRQYARVPVYMWVFPTISMVVAILLISRPIETDTLFFTLKVIGWAFMYYGVLEFVLIIRMYLVRKAYDKAEAAKVVTGDKMVTDGIEDAEVVEE
jgi:putative membrane protein